jgi:hypothetical protein
MALTPITELLPGGGTTGIRWSAMKNKRRAWIAVAALALSAAGCSSSHTAASPTTSGPQSTSVPGQVTTAAASKLDKATTCTQTDAAQSKLTPVLTAVSNGDVSTVEMVTKLDPIRASFENLAKTTSDVTLADLLSSEAEVVNKVESAKSTTGSDTELSIDMSSITSECNRKTRTLPTIPKNLSIPGETTVPAP